MFKTGSTPGSPIFGKVFYGRQLLLLPPHLVGSRTTFRSFTALVSAPAPNPLPPLLAAGAHASRSPQSDLLSTTFVPPQRDSASLLH